MKQNKIKILFIIKKRSYFGVSYGLVNSCRFIGDALEKFGIETKVAEVIDNNCIDREVNNFKPTHVFIEALWVVPSKFHVLLKLYPKIKWFIRLHSQVPFLGYEGIAFEWLKEYNLISKQYKNFFISTNSHKLISELKDSLDINMEYSPNIYEFDPVKRNKPRECSAIDIGCFGAIRPFKNHLNQAIAALIFANKHKLKLKFHINSSRFENMGESILKNLTHIFKDSKHELIQHSWMNHKDFLGLVRKMDIGMQVSYTETFNIVAADFVSNNIPLIGSDEIEWLSSFYQARPNSIDDIVKKLDFSFSPYNDHFIKLNTWGLTKHNKKATLIWLDLLGYSVGFWSSIR